MSSENVASCSYYIHDSTMSTLNEELLLKVICSYPAIYDPQRKGYSNRIKTDQAWANVSLSVKFPVEDCKKKWKSLREKFYREKQKINSLTRSGMEYTPIPKWPFMSFFEYMFENRTPRTTSSSTFLDTNQEENSNNAVTTVNEEVNPLEDSVQFTDEDSDDLNVSHTPQMSDTGNRIPLSQQSTKARSAERKSQKRKVDAPDPILGVLNDISSAVKNVSKCEQDKSSEFARYLVAELNDLPKSVCNEFIDETLIRLLQLKRKHKHP